MRKWNVDIVGEIELNDRTKVRRAVDIQVTEDDVMIANEEYVANYAWCCASDYFQDLYPNNVFDIDHVSTKVREEF